jgi:hypothetical protein
LARIFGEPPIITVVLLLLVSLAIAGLRFSRIDRNRRVSGLAVLTLGIALALSDGFSGIGQGPLGWLTWVIGD